MQIIGSFPRLILSLVTLAVLVATFWSFPESSLKSALIVGQLLPTLASCALFTYLCKDSRRALLLTLAVAYLGFVLSPEIEVVSEYRSWFDDYVFKYCHEWPVYSAVGALVAGIAIYLMEFVAGRRKTLRLAKKNRQHHSSFN